jgi:glutaredoxin
METRGIKYEIFSLGRDFTSEEFIKKFGGGSTFPQVYHDNTSVGGMRDTVKYIAENNLL